MFIRPAKGLTQPYIVDLLTLLLSYGRGDDKVNKKVSDSRLHRGMAYYKQLPLAKNDSFWREKNLPWPKYDFSSKKKPKNCRIHAKLGRYSHVS